MNGEKWDRRFLDMAKLVSTWSKDPSTQTGAVITNGKRVVSTGYNGFAVGVSDDPARYADRELKYRIIVHCERNAIIFAQRSLEGCTLYTYPFLTCSTCGAMAIQAGIKTVVAPTIPEHLKERWEAPLREAAEMYAEAGVSCILYGPEPGDATVDGLKFVAGLSLPDPVRCYPAGVVRLKP